MSQKSHTIRSFLFFFMEGETEWINPVMVLRDTLIYTVIQIIQGGPDMEGIFRKKSLERVSSPEQLDDYIHVTTPSVWIVLIATVFILMGMLAWSVFGTVDVTQDDGSTKTIHPITFVTN